ncbi:TetR-like C-terminal domain-containing protein [Streptomyces sp. YS-3]|uniref:TetR-like C-terminal domain-containing protein n=1 Tax=Streptomyces sp. YS-3 TaxID=3381352 RepID=UPI0038628B0D
MDNPGTGPDELTGRLIDEAGRLLAAHGPEGLSLRKLAAATGTSTMSVYTRFGGKPQLLAAMHREALRRLGAALDEASTGASGSLEQLAGLGHAYRRAALASSTLYAMMFGPPAPGFEPVAEDEAAARATYQPLIDGIRRCVEDGLMAGDAERIAVHLWAVLHGMVGLELAGRLPVPADAVEQAYEEALVFAAAPFLVDPAARPHRRRRAR